MQYAHNIDHILIIAAVLLFMTVFVKCLPIISKHLVCRCFTSLSGHAGNDCQTQPSCVLFKEELGNTFPWARFYSVRHSTASLSFLGRSEYSVRIAGGVGGVEPPYLTLPTPLPLVKIRPRGGRVSTPPPPKFC